MSPDVQHRTFRWLCWLPLALLLVTRAYVSEFEGFGRWAAAPLLLGPVLLSAVATLLGLPLLWRQPQPHGLARTALAVAIAALPLIWFLVRALST